MKCQHNKNKPETGSVAYRKGMKIMYKMKRTIKKQKRQKQLTNYTERQNSKYMEERRKSEKGENKARKRKKERGERRGLTSRKGRVTCRLVLA